MLSCCHFRSRTVLISRLYLPFCSVEWDKFLQRKVKPPYVPAYKAPNDTSNFDKYPDSEEDRSVPLTAKDKESFKDF